MIRVIVQQELKSLELLAAEKNIRILSNLDNFIIRGQPVLLAQLAQNLIENAILYSPVGSAVYVTLRFTETTALLSISNPGHPVSLDEVALLAEPFHRGLNPRTSTPGHPKPGFGLGLSIVAAIASTHNADLTVRPREGGGLTADVAFPVQADPIS